MKTSLVGFIGTLLLTAHTCRQVPEVHQLAFEAACEVDTSLLYLATQDKSAVKLKITPADEVGEAVYYELGAWNLPEGSVLTDEKGEPITLGSKFRLFEDRLLLWPLESLLNHPHKQSRCLLNLCSLTH